LREEFLFKTDSGYPKETRVTLLTWQPLRVSVLTLATPGNPLLFFAQVTFEVETTPSQIAGMQVIKITQMWVGVKKTGLPVV